MPAEQTDITHFLDTWMMPFDYEVLNFFHGLAVSWGEILTPFFKAVSLMGEMSVAVLVLAALLCISPKYRKAGICMIVAVLIGALFTNIIIKDLVARPRPFIDTTSIFFTWWQFVGATEVPEFSFPSGHTTAAMAGMTALFLFSKKRFAGLGFIYVLLMASSRMYLVVHYPSDILGGVIVGAAAALIAYVIVKQIFKRLDKRRSKQLTEMRQDELAQKVAHEVLGQMQAQPLEETTAKDNP